MPEYTDEQKTKLMTTYEHLSKLLSERKKLFEKLDYWYYSQVLGLVPKKSYKILEITEWVKPNDHRSTGRSNPGGDRPSSGA